MKIKKPNFTTKFQKTFQTHMKKPHANQNPEIKNKNPLQFSAR